MLMAVGPATSMSCTLYFFSSDGARTRSSFTRAAVDGAVWPAFGITWKIAVSAAWLGVAWVTATTPGTFSMAFARSCTVSFGLELLMTLAVTARGEL